MRVLLLTILILMTKIQLFAQATENKTIKNDEYEETFSVLKEDQSIRHGHSKKVYLGHSARIEEGQYDHNKKIGIWEYYNDNGEIEQKFDFDRDSLIFFNPFNAVSSSWILRGDSIFENTTGKKPILLGGDGKYASYLRYLKYPAEARENRREGVVFVSARVTSDGKLVDEKVEKKLGMGLDEEALKIIQMLPDEWIPLKVNGTPVDSKVLFRLRFRL
jgi:periplasmic protein TonB